MSRGETERFDVFLNHSASDAVLAEAVRQQLTEAGLACFTPTSGVAAGGDYEGRLRHALDICRAYVPLLSRAFVESPYLFIEVGAAWGAGVPVLPLLNDLQPTDVPVFLRRFTAYPLWKGLPKLIAAVRKLPERQPA